MRYVLCHDLFLLLVRLGLNYATQGLAIGRKAPVLDLFMIEKRNVNKEKRYMVGQGGEVVVLEAAYIFVQQPS